MVMNTEQMFKLSTLHWQWWSLHMSEAFSQKGRKIAPTNIVKKITVNLSKMEFMTKKYFRMQKELMVGSELK